MVGYGVKTKEKLFIKEVKITSQGRRIVQDIIDKSQKKLPLKKRQKAIGSRQ